MRSGLLFVLFLAAVSTTAHADILSKDGVVFIDGKPLAKANSEQDSDPVLSPDGKRVVFVRNVGGKPLKDCAADGDWSDNVELWVVGRNGKGARRLLFTHSDPDLHKAVCDFRNAQYSSNGRLLYFESSAWATSGAIHVYDFKTGKERFFVAGNGHQVLRDCPVKRYRDHVAVSQHRYLLFGGSYDWLWLFSPAGKEIGPIGENADMLESCD